MTAVGSLAAGLFRGMVAVVSQVSMCGDTGAIKPPPGGVHSSVSGPQPATAWVQLGTLLFATLPRLTRKTEEEVAGH